MPSFDPTTTALAGVLLIPLVITLIQFAKQLVPDAPGNLWLGAALAFGVAGQVAATIADSGVPGDFNGWLALGVWGLVTGLAAAKTYDETIRERFSLPGAVELEVVDDENALHGFHLGGKLTAEGNFGNKDTGGDE